MKIYFENFQNRSLIRRVTTFNKNITFLCINYTTIKNETKIYNMKVLESGSNLGASFLASGGDN